MTNYNYPKDYQDNGHISSQSPLVGVPEPNPSVFESMKSEYVPVRSEVLREAESLVNGQRQNDYGTPQENMDRIATMFQILFPERQWKASDIPLALAAVKFGRACQGYTRDTAVDLAGYASLWAEVSEDED